MKVRELKNIINYPLTFLLVPELDTQVRYDSLDCNNYLDRTINNITVDDCNCIVIELTVLKQLMTVGQYLEFMKECNYLIIDVIDKEGNKYRVGDGVSVDDYMDSSIIHIDTKWNTGNQDKLNIELFIDSKKALRKEEQKPEILEIYSNKKYDVKTSIETIESDKEILEALNQYFAKKISFDQFMFKVDSYCPDNSCHWCNNKCINCDLNVENCKSEKEMDGKCRICWQRCLNKKL